MCELAIEGLGTWLADLRGRLGRGELRSLPAVEAGVDGPTLSAKLATRYLLADYDHYDDLTEQQRRDGRVLARRRLLLADLQWLRHQLG